MDRERHSVDKESLGVDREPRSVDRERLGVESDIFSRPRHAVFLKGETSKTGAASSRRTASASNETPLPVAIGTLSLNKAPLPVDRETLLATTKWLPRDSCPFPRLSVEGAEPQANRSEPNDHRASARHVSAPP